MIPEIKNTIPTNQGLQRFSTGVNQKYDTPMFETLAMADNSKGREPETNVAIPSDLAVEQGKEWVDENRL